MFEIGRQFSIFDYLQEDSKTLTVLERDENGIPYEYLYKALCIGTGFKYGKENIYKLYNTNMSNRERAKKIKDLYGMGGSSFGHGVIDGLTGYDTIGKDYSIMWNENGKAFKENVTWSKVERLIYILIEDGKYFPIYDEYMDFIGIKPENP